MRCDRCGAETIVLDTRITSVNTIRRRRQCGGCGFRFTTHESTVNQAKLLEQRRAALRSFRTRMTPEERKAFDKRNHLRRSARAEAKKTGEPVQAIYERWGVQ
ncbi:hypothetical protein [Bosea massiliensis]|uniref:Transcriptional repressor NrdR-like N-terminal domain-containing protein n=1 Tax=Bosea massiliensis TaxID=151419 RepID=A0ABW0PA12_9HYPH